MIRVRIRIEAHGLPWRDVSKHSNVHVGVQGRGQGAEILDLVASDVSTAVWEFDATTLERADGIDVRGPYVQGGPGGRFIYLTWGTLQDGEFAMFGRSKLMLTEVDQDTMAAAVRSGTLVGRVGLIDERGKLRLASIKPPAITWSGG